MKITRLMMWCVLFFSFSLVACSGTRPPALGGVKTALDPGPNTPNCVFSGVVASDHYIEPAAFVGSVSDTSARLKAIIQEIPRARLVVDSEYYLYVEVSSRLFGFVDDVEFLLKPVEQQVALRSASRLGYSDLGVNRSRMELVKDKLLDSSQ